MLSVIIHTTGQEGWFWLFWDIAIILSIAFMVVIVILENHDPVKTIAWLLILFLLPVLGIILYIYLGRNPRKRKVLNEKEILDQLSSESLLNDQMELLRKKTFIRNQKLFPKRNMMRLLLSNSKALVSERNTVSVLNNGEATFSSMIAELKKAVNHIHMEFFIIEDDTIGNRIKDVLIERARAGVKIRVIYDDVGSWSLSRRYVRELTGAGVEVYSFMPVRSYFFANKINYRLHRKILVIDGQTGFVGGLNIADRYMSGPYEDYIWRDTHIYIRGEAVHALQMIFLMDWYFVSGDLQKEPELFQNSEIEDETLVQIVASGPDSDWQSIMQAYFSAIATAIDYVYISTPYFLPNESIRTALKTAALSGVDVRIILPEKNDSLLAGMSSRSFLKELLEAGVRIYFYTKGFTHSKLMIVDDVFGSVGTANMDIRSFNQDFEVNALIYDEKVAAELKEYYLEDTEHSRQVSLEEWNRRKLSSRIVESLARIFSPLM